MAKARRRKAAAKRAAGGVKARRQQRRKPGPRLTAAAISKKLRDTIAEHLSRLEKRINQNQNNVSAAEIRAAFGADEANLTQYLALAGTLGGK